MEWLPRYSAKFTSTKEAIDEGCDEGCSDTHVGVATRAASDSEMEGHVENGLGHATFPGVANVLESSLEADNGEMAFARGFGVRRLLPLKWNGGVSILEGF